MTAYAVVWRPDATQRVRLVGPFYSEAKALKVVERLNRLDEADQGYDDELGLYPMVPEVIAMESVMATVAAIEAGER